MSDRRPGAARPRLGIVLLVASNGLTATVDAFAKRLSGDLHGIQIVWGYFAVIFVLLLGYALARPTPLRRTVATRRLGLHLARAGMLALTISTLFMGLAYIPLADAIAISFTAPLFIIALAVPLLGERVGWHRWVAVVVGLLGVVVVMRPGAGTLHWAAFLPLVSAVFFALFQIMTRQLTATEDTFTTMFYTGAGGLLWASLVVAYVWRDVSVAHLGVFAGIGLLGVGAHLCMIRAFAAAPASLLAPFNYAKLLWAAALGYAMFGDVPAAQVIAGSAVIVASGLYVYLRESHRPA